MTNNNQKQYSFAGMFKGQQVGTAVGYVEGWVTRDPETRDGNGKPVTNFSIAMNNANRKLGYALQTELPDTESIFLDCAGWERMSDRVSKVIHKGQLVGLAGLLKVENYKDNNGNDRQRLRLTVNDFQIRYSGKNNNNAQNTQPTNNSSYQEPSGKVDVTEDDLPF